MDPQLAETTIKTYLNEIRSRLDKAAGIGVQVAYWHQTDMAPVLRNLRYQGAKRKTCARIELFRF
jgi:hypothetical protein